MPDVVQLVHPDGSSIRFDAVVGGRLAVSDDVTTHPLEDGSSVSDHVTRGPWGVSLRVLHTESPQEGDGGATGPDRVFQALDFLGRCRGELLTLVLDRRFRTIGRLVLTRQSGEIRRLRDLPLELEFRQVRIAYSERVSPPMADPQESGSSATEDADEQGAGAEASEADTESASILARLLGMGG